MLVIKIEIWPLGRQDKAREIGRVVISNDGTGTPEIGNYDVALTHAERYHHRPSSWKGGRVVQHKRTLSPYHLVVRAIKAALAGSRTVRSDQLVIAGRDE